MSVKDQAYISWLEERVVRLECELAETRIKYDKAIVKNIAFLDTINKSLNQIYNA